MDLEDRIRRRQRRDGIDPLVLDDAALSPVSHVAEPTDRSTLLERLLDLFDPVFDGALPPNAYVWGERGTGKSAVLTALCRHMSRLPLQTGSIIHTTTRAQATSTPAFVYLDAREAASDFALSHALLDGLVEERVPEHGLGTATLRDRLTAEVADRSVVAVVDHLNEPDTLSATTVEELLAPLGDGLRWVGVGRNPPDDLAWEPPVTIDVPPYRAQVLVDVVTARADDALGGRPLDHADARRIAKWADGDAHDALAALLVAADAAASAGKDRIETADVEVGIASVPRPSVSLARILTLPANRQSVLRELIARDGDQSGSVAEATAAITASPRIDLSEGTVERFLYELAESGILDRIETDCASPGRPPSRLEPRFPPTAFSRLYDRQEG